MIVKSSDATQLTIQLTHEEIALVANALNEVFELDLGDSEFYTRLGGTKQKATALHEQLVAACDGFAPT
jgi:hypothetical protein